MFRYPEALILSLVLMVWGLSATGGGLCGAQYGIPCGPQLSEAQPASPLPPAQAAIPQGADRGAQDGGSAARAAYERTATGLWRAAANGTCLGTLGAWHLTPYRIIAEGTVFEILAVLGDPSRVEIVARRIHDMAPAEFVILPRSRGRIDVVGGVLAGTPRYGDALYRCRQRLW